MSEYNKAIMELRKNISARDEEIKKIRISIGKEISLLKSSDIKDTPVYESYTQVGNLKKEIPSKKKIIKEINKLSDSMADLDKQIGESKAVLIEREKAYKSIYEHIGTAAYTAFKSNQEKLRQYEHIFAELIKLDSRLAQFNKVDITTKDSEKNIIKQFVDAAKSMYRNQKHKFIQLRYPGLYRQAGKEIQTTDFIEDAAFEALNEAMNPLVDNEKAITELNNTIHTLQEEKNDITETLFSLEVKDKPQKRIREINDEILLMEEHIEDCYIEIFDVCSRHECFKKIKNEKIEEYSGKLATLEKENEKSEDEIKRYETLIKIETLNGKITKAGNKIEHIKNQIVKQEQELKAVEKECAQLEKQKKVLEKTLETK
jgi:hypothetical protein